jgi:hypothetical protein
VLLAAETEYTDPPGGFARFGFTGSSMAESGILTTEAGQFRIRGFALGSRSGEPLPVVAMATRPVARVWAQRPGLDDVYRATFTPDGVAWINPEPLPGDRVYDSWTGQELDTSEATAAGSLPVSSRSSDFAFTTCEDGTCDVSYRQLTGPLLAPTDGLLVCESSGTAAFYFDDNLTHRLRFHAIDFRPWGALGDPGGPRSWRADVCRNRLAGDAIGPSGHYLIRAYDVAGNRISIGIAPNGDLYTGEFVPTIGCPCQRGN